MSPGACVALFLPLAWGCRGAGWLPPTSQLSMHWLSGFFDPSSLSPRQPFGFSYSLLASSRPPGSLSHPHLLPPSSWLSWLLQFPGTSNQSPALKTSLQSAPHAGASLSSQSGHISSLQGTFQCPRVHSPQPQGPLSPAPGTAPAPLLLLTPGTLASLQLPEIGLRAFASAMFARDTS